MSWDFLKVGHHYLERLLKGHFDAMIAFDLYNSYSNFLVKSHSLGQEERIGYSRLFMIHKLDG